VFGRIRDYARWLELLGRRRRLKGDVPLSAYIERGVGGTQEIEEIEADKRKERWDMRDKGAIGEPEITDGLFF
jgi:hypothetical protein